MTAMQLDFTAQRRYCVQLGLIPADADGIDAWYRDPVSREVSGLLAGMETQQRKISAAAYWMRSAMDTVDRRFDGGDIHTVGLNSCGEVARHAIDYDMAVAAYCALQDQLQQLVTRIRHDQGYEVSAFTKLEDHPEHSPEDAKAIAELAKIEQHLRDFRGWTPAAQRTHLRREHGTRVTAQAGPSPALLHDTAHEDDLDALRARVAAIQAA